MAKKNTTIDEVLEKQNFNEKEKKAFHEMISYAKICQKGMEENLKNHIDQKIKEVLEK